MKGGIKTEEEKTIKLESGRVLVVLPKNNNNIEILKSVLEVMKTESVATENNSKKIVQKVFSKVLEEDKIICEKCGKSIKESADKDFPLCEDCLEDIEKRFNLSKKWDTLTREGKRYRIKIATEQQEDEEKEFKLVYNPDNDPILTGVE